MTSSERQDCPSDKKMIIGVLKSGVISLELDIVVNPHLCAFHCRSNTARAVARALSKFVPVHQLLRPINLSTSSLGVLVSSFSKRTFPSLSIQADYNSREIPRGFRRRGQYYMHPVGYQWVLLVLLPPLLSSKRHTMPIKPLRNGYYV